MVMRKCVLGLRFPTRICAARLLMSGTGSGVRIVASLKSLRLRLREIRTEIGSSDGTLLQV